VTSTHRSLISGLLNSAGNYDGSQNMILKKKEKKRKERRKEDKARSLDKSIQTP